MGADTKYSMETKENNELENGEVQSGQEAVKLKRKLQSRHITMIALGGSLGTGLLIGTGSALVKTGPAGIFIDYSIIGLTVFMVMAALGEMISFMPVCNGFGGYATRFVDPCLGFATHYVYLFKYLLATPNQMAAATLIMKYWVGDTVNPAVFISIILVIIVVVNYTSVQAFGEFEFWLSSAKVCIAVGLILCMLVIAAGGGPTHDATGFRYWKNPGAFAEYKTTGHTGQFVGVWSGMITAVYAFSGTELVAITVGEAKSPRIVMPKAIKMTFFRICFFYVAAVFLLGLVVPYSSHDLVFASSASTSAAASPFVVAIKLAQIKGLDHVINACLLIFVLSAANTDMYTASRTLYGIAVDGKAPEIFAWTNKRGVPVPALILPACFCLLAYMTISSGAKDVFQYLLNVTAVFGILTWISILVSHIFFCRAIKAQRIPASRMAYRAPLRHYGSYAATGFLSLLVVTKGAETFIGEFDWKSFIVQYIGLPVYLGLIFGYKFWFRTTRWRASEADLATDVPTESIADERARYAAEKELALESKGPFQRRLQKCYRALFQWLF